jgi:guanylate kinase
LGYLERVTNFQLNSFYKKSQDATEVYMTRDKHNFNLMNAEPLLIVISGPSGVGKDSVVGAMQRRGLPFHFVITATTRPQRDGEIHGVDYYFFSKEEFAEMIEKDKLLEYAFVYNDYKGIPKSQVRQALESGRDVVMRLDVQGAATIRELYPEALLIFLTTDSEDELVERLKARKTESPAEMKLRIATARRELRRMDEFDYVIPNRDNQLEKSVDMIEAIIQAEHHRVKHRKVTL